MENNRIVTQKEDIDNYLSKVPPDARKTLQEVRSIVQSAAPKAVEKISYRIPTFDYLGSLVAFAAFKDHCSFFVMSYRVMGMFKKELKPYWKAKATLHFTAEKPLPVALIEKIVRARMKENEVRRGIKKSRR